MTLSRKLSLHLPLVPRHSFAPWLLRKRRQKDNNWIYCIYRNWNRRNRYAAVQIYVYRMMISGSLSWAAGTEFAPPFPPVRWSRVWGDVNTALTKDFRSECQLQLRYYSAIKRPFSTGSMETGISKMIMKSRTVNAAMGENNPTAALAEWQTAWVHGLLSYLIGIVFTYPKYISAAVSSDSLNI